MTFKLILAAPVPALADAFARHFDGMKNVVIHRGMFETVPSFDAMVSAANSFGLMDGGVDLAITRYFGEPLMRRVQEKIIRDYLGEQVVGTAFTIPTNHPKHPWLVHAPTMRVPDVIAGTDATYRATWAALLAVHRCNQCGDAQIRTVVFPGMGTGCGRVPPDSAAAQMALAWRHYNERASGINWPYAMHRDDDIRKAIIGNK